MSPQLLVSVQNAREAADALAAGADWIDVKKPSAGSLGRPSAQEITEVVEAIAGRLPISVALGELHEPDMLEAVKRLPLSGIDRVKVGLSSCRLQPNWRHQLTQLISALPHSTSFVAVQYADWRACEAPSPSELLEFAQNERCAALLIDTFDKKSGGLLDWISEENLENFFTEAHAQKLTCVAAGSLTTEVFAKVINAGADVLAVRGAACEGRERTAAISSQRVRVLRDFLSNSLPEIS